jgi:N-acetylmuramoyl-L-alanine amidase
MTKLIWPLLGVCSLIMAVGCQTETTTSVAYPAPSFDAPRMAVQASAPLPPTIPNYPVLPPMPRVAVLPPSHSAARMSGVPASWIPPVAPRPWRWIVVHHSDTTTGGAAAFDKMHRAKGWDELGYDFVIGNGTDTGDGQIEVGPRWTKQKIGAHAKTSDNRFNEYGIGICMVGNFMVERPTPAQLKSLDRLIAYLMVTYRISPENILGHRDTKPTECPGQYVSLPMIRRQAAALAGASFYEHKVSASAELLTSVPN